MGLWEMIKGIMNTMRSNNMNEYKILDDDHKMDEIKTAENVKSEDTIVREIIKNEEIVKKENEIKDLTSAVKSLESTLYLIAMLAFLIWYFNYRQHLWIVG